jgi:DNA primase
MHSIYLDYHATEYQHTTCTTYSLRMHRSPTLELSVRKSFLASHAAADVIWKTPIKTLCSLGKVRWSLHLKALAI